ncbi:glycosyltransferase family 4 protein [Chitinibacter sp. SCUT-21]|uniref:glycosyltransferase family 4 protein n=1 Tax=Chitinibacter sp. SCUT-21 TaxID=2970891 RepID=UPI0035A64879
MLDKAASTLLFDLVLTTPSNFNWRVKLLIAQAYLRWGHAWWTDPNYLYLNTSHSGLEQSKLRSKLAATKNGVFFVHDLIPITHPEYCRPGESTRHQARMQTVLECGCAVIVNSSATRNELQSFASKHGFTLPPTTIAWLASADLPIPNSQRPLSEPYFVMLGTIEARKNHALILQLWRQLVERLGTNAPKLVIIGQRGWECENALDLLERCDVLRSHVLEIRRCSDTELASYLKHGQALLFPSFAEGFGMPIVEAFSQNLPVLCSDLPAFREIAGDIPEYLNPLDGLGWMTLIEQYSVSTHPARLAQLARLANFQPPTWAIHFAVVDEFLGRLNMGEE